MQASLTELITRGNSKNHATGGRFFLLDPSIKAIYLTEPNGREAKSRLSRMFRIPYSVFRDQLLDLAVEKWLLLWKANKVDCCGLPVGDLELKLLGALFTLGTAATHFVVSMNTNLSEETHRSFIYMSRSYDEQYIFVVNEYRDIGLPGCVGSVDYVHIGWEQCPNQYFHMYR